MLKSIFAVLSTVVFLLYSCVTLGVFWIIGRFNKKKADMLSLRYVQNFFKYILKICGTKVIVIGEENVPKDQAVMYIANHRSYFDTLITYSRTPGLTGYIAKDGVEKVPLLRTWMRRLHCLFLNRSSMKEGMKTILTAIEYVKQGISITVFPEGTRGKEPGAKEQEMNPFKEGCFKIATKTGCPIVPMAITGSREILESHFPKMKSATVVLRYGKPIDPASLADEEKKHIGVYVQNVVRELLDENEPVYKAAVEKRGC